jgi:hypothetical protein
MLQLGRLASSDDPYSYVGGSLSSWQGHPSQTGQRIGARLGIVYWSSRLGVVLTTPPHEKFLVTKPHIKKIHVAAKVLQEL